MQKISRINTSSQRGFVSIIVASMIMVILALITIGFTRIMQQEQRQVLDRQLSRQALYAAESGVNSVYAAIRDDSSAIEQTVCDASSFEPEFGINSQSQTVLTCVQYDKTPSEIQTLVARDKSKFMQLATDSGNNFTDITFRWDLQSGSGGLTGLPICGDTTKNNLPPSRTGVVPVIKIDLTNISGTLSRDSLIQNSEYIYALPCTGTGGTNTFTWDTSTLLNRGDVVAVECSGTATNYPCSLTIYGLGSNKYFARIKAIYEEAKLQITANGVSVTGTPEPVEFSGAQTVIDVTARATDVVRRLRVAIPFAPEGDAPEAAVQVFDGVCKLLRIDDNPASTSAENMCPPGSTLSTP